MRRPTVRRSTCPGRQSRRRLDLDALVANLSKIQFQYNLGADFDDRGIQVWERAKAAATK